MAVKDVTVVMAHRAWADGRANERDRNRRLKRPRVIAPLGDFPTHLHACARGGMKKAFFSEARLAKSPNTPRQAVTAGSQPPSHKIVIRVYDAVGIVIETHEHKGDFKEWRV